ncbi:Eukaryotic translation initiation factor 3 subunit J [Colletotrichum orbiculare MAFF 240422]|uniref:Eukaryotic translation initiation factor 3 subunit J n=1 Tax=Colletotrichum orbiculare (strain 104-T / ATCC 96160 / CBS 514.97 / LARS 414 / MAFF 240422) TaxID=1213857 RepID=A0A484FWT7_COLOR|nr:Eukaryotic translation initiation factor 3 subunit J [Colletotrichum orbiculare MAFF 240422]
MPPKKWDEEESGDESSDSVSPPTTALRRTKFDDEEDEEDVLDSWDAAEDSEVEREKAKKAEEAKVKAAEEAKKNKKSKTERIAEIQAERQRRAAESDYDEEETEAERRERLRRTEKESDMKHAEDLFGDIGVPAGRKANLAGTAVSIDPNDPTKTANIAEMPLFNPVTKTQFEHLRTTLTPIIANNVKKAHYGLFLQEFAKALAKDLPSDQIKKVASTLTALGNEKMKEEKAAQGGNKKSKAAKTKVSANISRASVAAETETYDNDDFGDDDFM